MIPPQTIDAQNALFDLAYRLSGVSVFALGAIVGVLISLVISACDHFITWFDRSFRKSEDKKR